MKCDLCNEGIEEPPFTIVTPQVRIKNVCGECTTLFANREWDELEKRLKEN